MGVTTVETIQEDRNLPEEQYDMLLKMLGEQSGRLDALIKDILSLAALENDPERQRREFLPVDLQDLLKICAQSLRQEAAQHGQTIRIVHTEPLSVSGDVQLLEQALSNLISNAIKYSGSPDIELSLSRDRNSAVISVTDHGCGIPAENQPRIFERFYRVHHRIYLGEHLLKVAVLAVVMCRRRAPTSMSAELPSGKAPTTRVRRRFSFMMRSRLLFVRKRVQCSRGKSMYERERRERNGAFFFNSKDEIDSVSSEFALDDRLFILPTDTSVPAALAGMPSRPRMPELH